MHDSGNKQDYHRTVNIGYIARAPSKIPVVRAQAGRQGQRGRRGGGGGGSSQKAPTNRSRQLALNHSLHATQELIPEISSEWRQAPKTAETAQKHRCMNESP